MKLGDGVKNACHKTCCGFSCWSNWGTVIGEGNSNLLQYSCLENPMDQGAWRAAVQGVTKESGVTEQVTHNWDTGL